MSYRYQYRDRVAADEIGSLDYGWDLFISAYNSSFRVQNTFRSVNAGRKVWFVQSEYDYADGELPNDEECIRPVSEFEADSVREFIEAIGPWDGARIAVDITGFMRHTLLVLLYHLYHSVNGHFWLLYGDPGRYTMNELTLFSRGGVREVRQVPGYFGSRDSGDVSRDVLVLGTGYDVDMMRAVIESKRRAQRTDLFGLPSLQPPMYQENMLSVAVLDGDDQPSGADRRLYAGANDPFGTAQILHDSFADRLRERRIGGLYLAPTGTKAQTVGFALFFLAECQELPASVLLPFPARYERESSLGHSRSWIFEVDLALLKA